MALRFDKIEFYSSGNHQYPEITTDGTSSLRLKPNGSKYLDLESDSSTVYLKSNGNIYLRPNGASTNRVQFTTSGVTFSDKIIPNAHIELPYTAELRTLDSNGTVRTIARANSNKLQYGWSYGGDVEIMGGGSYTPRITINGSGGAVSIPNFTGAHSFAGTLDLNSNDIVDVGDFSLATDGTMSPFNFSFKNYTQSNITGYSTSGSSFDDWVKIGTLSEAEGVTYLNIKCDAHSTFSFTIGRGYWGSNVATITCTNAVFNRNASYPNLRGIRIIREDDGSGGGSSTYGVNVRMYRSANHVNFTWYCKAWGGGYNNTNGCFDFLSTATTAVGDGTGHTVISKIDDIGGPTAATDGIRKSIHASEDIVSEKKVIATTEFSVPAHFKATDSNMKLHAGGNHILNIDLNGKIYPSSDNAKDLGYTNTSYRFRNLYLSSEAYTRGVRVYDGGTINLYTVTNNNNRGTFKVYDSSPHLRISTSGGETIGFYDGGVEGTLNVEIQGDGDLNLVTGNLQINGTNRINTVGDGLFTSLYIGGTNVIDTNRNLTNIANGSMSRLALGGSTLSSGEDLRVGGIRGRFSNELIHMYNRVNIGYPSGWAGQGAPNYGISTYGGADLAINTGTVRVTTGSIANSDAATRGFIMDGNYTNGQYRHRWRKQDPGGGVPLYLDYASGTANSFTTIARFGPYSSNPENLQIYGQTRINSNLYLGVYGTTEQGKLLLEGSTANKRSTLQTTNGNLHIDSADGHAIYLNYYDGTQGVSFGSGSGTVAWMGPDGDLWKGSSDNSGSKYWHAGNDGSGSGLDSDTVDGVHAGSFLRLDTNMGTYGTGDYRQSQNLYPTPAGDLVNGSMNPFNTGINFCVVRHKVAESYAYDGLSWADCSSETDFNELLGGDFSHKWGGINLKRTKSDYIMYMSNQTGYCFIGWLVLTHSAHHNSFQIKIETTNTNPDTAAKRYENVGGATGWSVATHINSNIGSWPGWTIDKITQQFGGSADDYVRIRFTPNWASGQTTEISLGSLGMFASYGGGNQAASVARDYTISYNGDANYVDDKKVQLGDGNDLQLYHDGSNSYISDTNSSSDLLIRSNHIILQAPSGENMIFCNEDAEVKLYYNNSAKFETLNTGVEVTGSMTATGDVIAYSDKRLKTNVKTLDGSKVYKMRGVSFTKNDKEGSGVIAQELEKIAPELVNNDSEYKAVAYGNITGYLIEAIKDLKQEIEQLKRQINNG